MSTFPFYGRAIAATPNNLKLYALVFAPAVLVLMLVVIGLNAWAIAEFTGVTMWLTLPLLFAACFEATINNRKRALCPKPVRAVLFQSATALALYVFWQGQEWVKFSIVAVFQAHVIASFIGNIYFKRRQKNAAEREQIA